MNLNAISAQTALTAPLQPPGSGNQLGQSDFLRLMTTQLAYQDPFNPVDNQEMVAQMAQFSSLAGVTTTNETLDRITRQLAEQTELLDQIRASTTPPPQGAALPPSQ